MSPEVTVSLFAVIAGLIGSIVGSLITLYIGLRSINLEQRKLASTISENAEQAKVWDAEIKKVKTETTKLELEVQEIKLKRLELKRNEIKDLLVLFEKASFHPIDYDGDPTAVINGIRKTRITLQSKGASLIEDEKLAQKFHDLQYSLLRIEDEVSKKFPKVFTLALELADVPPSTKERLERVSHELDENVRKEAVAFTREKAVFEIRPIVKEIQDALKKLNVLLK